MSSPATLDHPPISLDQETLTNISLLAVKWDTSESEVISRVVKKTKEEEIPDRMPGEMTPVEALLWLQKNGLTREEADHLKNEIRLEREAKRYWWDERSA